MFAGSRADTFLEEEGIVAAEDCIAAVLSACCRGFKGRGSGERRSLGRNRVGRSLVVTLERQHANGISGSRYMEGSVEWSWVFGVFEGLFLTIQWDVSTRHQM
jgi:hypothetical protein